MATTDDYYNLSEDTIQAPPGDRKTTDHFTQDSKYPSKYLNWEHLRIAGFLDSVHCPVF
jgi:hypothetical protein